MKPLDYEYYLHPSDKAALRSLTNIPGYVPLSKAFLKNFSEEEFKVINMSTNLRLSDKQMKKYWDMLPPICEKLGIEVPELYLQLDVRPNAYTSGDTKPFIVITSGLLDNMPDYLIPTVLAHECGHIACHHVLYATMGRILLSSASAILGSMTGVALYPVQLAFSYWLRCSELSADRAAAICDGGYDKVVEMCMRFAGFKGEANPENMEEFIRQSEDYKKMIQDSNRSKTFEFLLFQNYSHPLNALRASENRDFAQTARFREIKEYIDSEGMINNLPIRLDKEIINIKDQNEMVNRCKEIGFENITLDRITEGNYKKGVVSLKAMDEKITDTSFYKTDTPLTITYFEPYSDQEIIDLHKQDITIPESTYYFLDKDVVEMEQKLRALGFRNITLIKSEMSLLIPKAKDHMVNRMYVDGKSWFDKNSRFPADSEIKIWYYAK